MTTKSTLLIINGAETRGVAQGRLNKTLFEAAKAQLQAHYHILETQVAEGYRVAEEQAKFSQADAVLFQYPVFWFGVPAVLKAYIDAVYEHGIFFEGSEHYGEGGLLPGRRYLLSTTWNAPAQVFEDQQQFFDGRSLEELLLAMHKTQQYVGMRALRSFAAFDVVANPNIEEQTTRWREHLQAELISPLETQLWPRFMDKIVM